MGHAVIFIDDRDGSIFSGDYLAQEGLHHAFGKQNRNIRNSSIYVVAHKLASECLSPKRQPLPPFPLGHFKTYRQDANDRVSGVPLQSYQRNVFPDHDATA